MPVIFKYPLKITDEQVIKVPWGAFAPLAVQHQRGVLCLWAEVRASSDAPQVEVDVAVVGTGNPFRADPGLRYVGTSQGPDGLVWHVYVGKPR